MVITKEAMLPHTPRVSSVLLLIICELIFSQIWLVRRYRIHICRIPLRFLRWLALFTGWSLNMQQISEEILT